MNSIFHRVSIRKFTDEPVAEEDLTRILRAGMQAPSAVNQQPWEFYVVTNRDVILELSKATMFSRPAAGAPVVIVPCFRKETRLPSMAEIDMAIAQENMWLETDSLGLGGVMLGIAPERSRMDKVRRIIGAPDSLEPFCLFALGHPAESRPQQDRFDESRIHRIG